MAYMVKTIRQRYGENPHLEITRAQGNELFDIEWENGLFPEQVPALWDELESMYGLKSHRGLDRPAKFYYADEVQEALERRTRGETVSLPQADTEEADEWPEPVAEYEEGDDDIVTAAQALDRIASRVKRPEQLVSRLGVESISGRGIPGDPRLYRYGDVRKPYQQREYDRMKEDHGVRKQR